MSSLSQFVGGAATTSIVNAFSAGGVLSNIGLLAGEVSNSREVLSGALTANVLTTLLSVSGSGDVPYLSVYTKDTTTRTSRMTVTVDDVVVFDATAPAVAQANRGMVAVGCGTSTNHSTQQMVPLRFNRSLVVKVASSLSETDKLAIAYCLHKRG